MEPGDEQMNISKKLAAAGISAIAAYILVYSAAGASLRHYASEQLSRRDSICFEAAPSEAVLPDSARTEQTVEEDTHSAAPIYPLPSVEPAVTASPDEGILETTITGGMTLKNETDYQVDLAAVTADGAGVVLEAGLPQILIIHTHSSEAYTPAGLDRYEASDTNRTEDSSYNIIRIGDELTGILEAAGLEVIHDRGVYDFPSYTGSYTRSGAAVEQYLADNPSIKIVIDLHRDALGDGEVVYKTMAEETGVCASQVMMLVGTDASGLAHPDWQRNLALVLYLQERVSRAHPTLMRPVTLVPQRYNQHLCPGMFILEVGCSGNTLQEALAAIRLYGESAAQALCELIAEAQP